MAGGHSGLEAGITCRFKWACRPFCGKRPQGLQSWEPGHGAAKRPRGRFADLMPPGRGPGPFCRFMPGYGPVITRLWPFSRENGHKLVSKQAHRARVIGKTPMSPPFPPLCGGKALLCGKGPGPLPYEPVLGQLVGLEAHFPA